MTVWVGEKKTDSNKTTKELVHSGTGSYFDTANILNALFLFA